MEPCLSTAQVQLWGGVECTVNRIGDQYFNQLDVSGHSSRLEDLELFADLGIRVLRYPVLWEATAPGGFDQARWSWAEQRLSALRTLGIVPIIGLVHHGSGPRHTSLVDDGFAAGLAQYAGLLAKRFPWVGWLTPVNEPLTTARFSGLYGLWYPHARDDRSFARALLNQCRGVALAMQAIREVNPDAKLLQTDDLGKVYSPDFSPRGEPRLKVSMVNIRTATPQIHRFGTDTERGQSSEWEAVIVEKLRVLWSAA
ncbi:MAG: hypothetical protein LC647_01530 [Beggiatoa sp.]|nr:hypothetical protein [Beggiatoa sp.]